MLIQVAVWHWLYNLEEMKANTLETIHPGKLCTGKQAWVKDFDRKAQANPGLGEYKV